MRLCPVFESARAALMMVALSPLAMSSGALAQPTYRLFLSAEGDGSGTIQVEPGGLVCSPPCLYNLPGGSQLTLTAVPDEGSVFTSWLGDRCFHSEPCAFTLNGDVTLRAGFGLPEVFAVTYTAPANGDTGVAPSSQPHLFFNRTPAAGPGLDLVSLTDAEGRSVPVTPVLRPTERRLVVIPTSGLLPGTPYTLSVPGDAVLDPEDNALPEPVLIAFTTALPGAPRVHLTAYPKYLMEGSRTRVSVWFEEPSTDERVVVLSQAPAGELTGLTEIAFPPGEVLGEVELRARLNHGSTSDVAVTLSAAEPAAGQESFVLQVKNLTGVTGPSLKFQAAGVISETDGDGVFESGEIGRVLFEVANFGSSMICNVVLSFRVLNTTNLSILGGAPFCDLGCMTAGQSRSCNKDFRADDDLPTGDYHLEVAGTSTANSILDQPRIQVVNRALPDLSLNVDSITSNPLPVGTVVHLEYTPWNLGHGFAVPPPLPAPGLPFFRVLMEVEGQTRVLYDRVYSEVRGDIEHDQTFDLPIVYPTTPGTHALIASIDPDGLVAEGDEANNQALIRFITVAEPNQAPVLASIGGPWTVSAGSEVCLSLAGSDPNSDTLAFSVSPLPTGAVLSPTGPGSASFCWTPSSDQGPGVWKLTFSVQDDGTPPLSDSEVVSIEVLNSADLVLSESADRNPVIAGEPVVLTVTVQNGGPSAAAATTVTGDLPPEATAFTTAGCAEDPSGAPICSLGSIPPGGQASFSIAMETDPAASGSLEHSSTVTSATPEENPGQESASIVLPIRAEAELSITKDDGQAVARPGQALVYSIVVSNLGPSDAESATVTDEFPLELLDCSWTCAPQGSAQCTPGPIPGPIQDSVSVPAGDSLTYTASCTVANDALAGVQNQAEVQADLPTVDPDLSNNLTTDTDQPETIFADGFETGDTSQWSATVPPP